MMDLKHINVRARSTDPDTSQQAAFDFEANQTKAAKSVLTVVEVLTDHGELTDFEIGEKWPEYWAGPFSHSLPAKARHWAREQGLVKRVGYGKHNNRQVIKWGLGQDEIIAPVCCPTCERKTRSQSVIDKIKENAISI